MPAPMPIIPTTASHHLGAGVCRWLRREGKYSIEQCVHSVKKNQCKYRHSGPCERQHPKAMAQIPFRRMSHQFFASAWSISWATGIG